MKTKKFLLGGLVLVFAIGSTVASVFQPEIPHVRGKVYINPETWMCVPISKTQNCHATQGEYECVVRIPVNGILTNVSAYKGPGYCDKEASCTTPLRRYTPTPVDGIPVKTILEVRPHDIR